MPVFALERLAVWLVLINLCTCRTTNTNGDTVNGLVGAVSIASKVTDNLMQKFMWLADTAGQVHRWFLLLLPRQPCADALLVRLP